MKPHFFVSDDGDTWIEWIDDSFRFALILNDKDPSWIYTSHEAGDSGELSSEVIEVIKKWATDTNETSLKVYNLADSLHIASSIMERLKIEFQQLPDDVRGMLLDRVRSE